HDLAAQVRPPPGYRGGARRTGGPGRRPLMDGLDIGQGKRTVNGRTECRGGTMDQHELLQIAERYLPGSCLGLMALPPELRMVLVRGEGSRAHDATGREYLDYMLGSGPLLLGHAHPTIVEAAQRQAALGSTFFALNEPAILLAEQLARAV